MKVRDMHSVLELGIGGKKNGLRLRLRELDDKRFFYKKHFQIKIEIRKR